MGEPAKSYTGRRRQRRTKWSVRLADRCARGIISIGGIGTIVAVCGVFAFLFWVVLPLFQSASLSGVRTLDVTHSQHIDQMEIDEYRTLGWTLSEGGILQVFDLATGHVLENRPVVDDGEVTAVSFSVNGDDVVLGQADGSIRIGTIGFRSTFLKDEDVPAEIRRIKPGEHAEFRGGIVKRTDQGQLRLQQLETAWESPMSLADEPIHRIAHVLERGDAGLTGGTIAAVTQQGRVLLASLEVEEDLLSFSTTIQLRTPIEVRTAGTDGRTDFLALAGRGDRLLLAWSSGLVERYDIERKEIHRAERIEHVVAPGAELTAFELLLGGSTVVCGDSTGRVQGLFVIRPESSDAGTTQRSDPVASSDLAAAEQTTKPDAPAPPRFDPTRLVSAHDFGQQASAVTCLAMSSRSRMFVVGYADGSLRTFFMTNQQQLAAAEVDASPLLAVGIAPKEDGLFAATTAGVWQCEFDRKYPEVSFSSLFCKVWYEGYPSPDYVWQSSGGTNDVEAKLSLMPLIFGTFKATLYSMMFGAPIALLAAIFTSEFMHPRTKARIKPTIEMMAGLPSVVLGFLAALVFAPVFQDWLPELLTSLVTVPLSLLLGAHLWQLLPYRFTIQFAWMRLCLAVGMLALGMVLTLLLGPAVEQWFFGGNILQWTDGQVGSGTGAWLMMLLPATTVLVVFGASRFVNPWLRRRAREFGRGQFALVNLIKFIVLSGVVLSSAWLVSAGLTAAGFDPRGTLVDTYIQRNALVVGFVMGFAVIPIIYTIAEDALSTVPKHLRSASLGAGATPWQTAIYIVIPTAMSGLFSALMIGLGRAVGETMIMLMAAGNTPIMEWNVFNGFRTLSANIAVELPEAAKDGTLFRTLFLTALTLFLITFLINTLAEIVRLRFRRRAYQL